MKKLYETRSVVHKIDSDTPDINRVIFRDFSLCQVYLSYRDETDFLRIWDIWHELIPKSEIEEEIIQNTDIKPRANIDPRHQRVLKAAITIPKETLWHKKELIRNLLAFGFYDSSNSLFQETFKNQTFVFQDEIYSKDSLESHYQFLISLPVIDSWMKTREFRKLPSKETKTTYRRSLRIFLQYLAQEHLDPADFKVEDIEDFFDQMKRDKLSTYYINKVYFAMLHFVRYAKPELEHDFVSFVRVSTPPSLLEISPKSVDKNTLTVLQKHLQNSIDIAHNFTRKFEAIRNKCIIDIMFETGVRLSEVTNLDIESIKDDTMLVYGKGNKERYIPLNSVVKRSLGAYLDAREAFIKEHKIDESRTERPLFYSNQKRRMSSRSIARIFERVEGLHPHLSRHTLITDMVRSKEDMPLIMGISGHSSMNMIARYAKPSQEDLLKALERKASRGSE